jgi:hypothetical protein
MVGYQMNDILQRHHNSTFLEELTGTKKNRSDTKITNYNPLKNEPTASALVIDKTRK